MNYLFANLIKTSQDVYGIILRHEILFQDMKEGLHILPKVGAICHRNDINQHAPNLVENSCNSNKNFKH